MKKLIAIFAVMFGVVILSVRAEDAVDATSAYESKCAVCHGKDGKGATKMGEKAGVKDLTDAKVQAAFTDEKAIAAIKDGLKDGDKIKMKPFGERMTEAEIKAVVKYVRTFSSAK